MRMGKPGQCGEQVPYAGEKNLLVSGAVVPTLRTSRSVGATAADIRRIFLNRISAFRVRWPTGPPSPHRVGVRGAQLSKTTKAGATASADGLTQTKAGPAPHTHARTRNCDYDHILLSDLLISRTPKFHSEGGLLWGKRLAQSKSALCANSRSFRSSAPLSF